MYPKIFRSPELIAKRKSKEERRGWGENLSRAIKPVNRIWVENCLNKGDTGRLFSHYRCSRPLNDALVGFYTGEESVSRQLNANFRQHARLSPISSEPPWFHVVLFPVTRFHLSTPPITLSLPLYFLPYSRSLHVHHGRNFAADRVSWLTCELLRARESRHASFWTPRAISSARLRYSRRDFSFSSFFAFLLMSVSGNNLNSSSSVEKRWFRVQLLTW